MKNYKKEYAVKIDTHHRETIKCPECNTIQQARVEHTIPWYTYIHECTNCGYMIMESEWDEQ
jgi:acetone carboxylase gamma subunit